MSGGGEVWEGAGVGHRITHEGDLDPPLTVVAQTLVYNNQDKLTAPGEGPQIGMLLSNQLASRLAHALETAGEVPEECPDPCGAIEIGSENTFIGPARRMAAITNEDHAHDCSWHANGPLLQGAKTVFVNKLPWGRRNDELDCGARIGEGEPTILIGGPPSEDPAEKQPPPWTETLAASGLTAADVLTDSSLAAKVSAAMASGDRRTQPDRRSGGHRGSQVGLALSANDGKFGKLVSGLTRGD